ncbi:MAG: TetR/AcrR family transcriptional regulator [Tissierellia bacterium]|nr:TetR/AcrR family transcriptional regulator [Tissierellia bacterium]
MDNISIRKKRIMTYFIDAADEIMREEGIKGVTLRKVAKKAGFNSATLYNYFENLDHLIFFAAMRYIKDYAQALPQYLKNANTAIDKFLLIWKCFCDYSFKDPEIYHAIFFADLDKDLEHYIVQYYKLFPEELGSHPKEVSTMLLKHNIFERGMAIIKECINEGSIRKEDAETLNEMATLIYEGILLRVIKDKISYDEAVHKTMKYIELVVNSLRINN